MADDITNAITTNTNIKEQRNKLFDRNLASFSFFSFKINTRCICSKTFERRCMRIRRSGQVGSRSVPRETKQQQQRQRRKKAASKWKRVDARVQALVVRLKYSSHSTAQWYVSALFPTWLLLAFSLAESNGFQGSSSYFQFGSVCRISYDLEKHSAATVPVRFPRFRKFPYDSLSAISPGDFYLISRSVLPGWTDWNRSARLSQLILSLLI